jgi:hypothetical protein
MKTPLQSFTLEFWENSYDFLKHGVPWYQWVGWFFGDYNFYLRMKVLSMTKQNFARGLYDPFHNKIVIFTSDIMLSVVQAMTKGADLHKTFGLQVYFTLIHEMLHKSRVAKDNLDKGGHKIDFDKFDLLEPALKDLFDGLLEMEYSNDQFTNHPENRRKPSA